MTLRGTLNVLIGLLGLGLVSFSASTAFVAARTGSALSAETAVEQDRTAIAELVTLLRMADLSMVEQAVLGTSSRPDSAIRATQALQDLRGHLAPDRPERAVIDAVAGSLLRNATALASALPAPEAPALDTWQRGLDAQYRALERLSDTAPRSVLPPDPEWRAIIDLRDACLRASGELIRARIRIELRLASGLNDNSPAARAFVRRQSQLIATEAGASAAALRLAAPMAASAAGPARIALGQIASFYQPDEVALLAALPANGITPAALAAWRERSGLAIDQLTQAAATLTALAAEQADESLSRQNRVFWLFCLATLASAALTGVALSTLSRRLFQPLRHVQTRLALIEANRFDAAPAQTDAPPELAALHASLDRLCDQGTRRDRMQHELARLSDRVVAANRQMLEDLEAAARVQHAQLPAAPRNFPGGVFHALFRPSRVVAGDTYDFLVLPDGRIRLFQIDVSGHGAPAALVSIASHIALKQALAAAPDDPLAVIVARVNRDWADDLPYFTLVAIEIDPAARRADFVQCGHPPLLRLVAGGGFETLGQGGLPIGVLPDAGFATLSCPFNPGDRLVLATDGVTETADPEHRLFGDDRFRDLLTFRPHEPVPRLFDRIERALWDWRGSEILDDDITILVLEAA